MSEPLERIRTALLRFKIAAGDQEVKRAEPDKPARQPTVVDEQSLAALFLSNRPPAIGPRPETGTAVNGAGGGQRYH